MGISDVKSRLFSSAPEGAATLFFIQIFSTLGFAVLYSTLVLYATKHLHLDEDGHRVDGCVRRVQLRLAPFRRLPGWPLPFKVIAAPIADVMWSYPGAIRW